MTRGMPIPETVTLHIPFRIVKRGGRKEMQMPDGATQLGRTDSTLVKALARAFRWKCMLGAKTIELIHENVHVDAVRDDLDTLVLDAELLEAVLGNPDPEKKAKEISVKLAGRLRKHAGNPKFKALGERLEDLKNRHQQGLLLSIDFLKELLALAKDVVETERETPEEEDIDRGKAALTELFEEARNGDTPVMVKRVVDDIDEIVRAVRFDGWQATNAGEREVKKALRQTLFRYKLHQDAELFEKAYSYIREYY